MAKSSGEVPAWVVSAIACLLLSSGATVAVMLFALGYKQEESVADIMAEAKSKAGQGGPALRGPPGPGQAPEGKGGPPADMAQKLKQALAAPRPSTQVVTLVEKLDVLTVEPGKLELTKDQRAKVVEHLDKLAEPDFLGDIPASDHVKAILSVLLEDQRKTLETAGFHWQDNPFAEASAYNNPGAASPVKNPFKEGEAAKRLKALKDRLTNAA